MPIASGAAGRVDVGVDASTAWTPDGLKKRTTPASRNNDSYLQRYQEQIKKNKSNLLKNEQENRAGSDQEDEGAEEEKLQENCNSDDPSPGKNSRGERSRKSLLCVLL